MCTVSWARQPGGYHLLSNRDEKRTRGVAYAPAVMERGGVRYVAPVDAEFGGTWIAVNEFGVSVSLLNGGQGSQPGRPRRSRGLLVKELAWAESSAESALWLKQLDLGVYAPFSLLILEPGRPAILADWNARDLTIDRAADPRMPLTSSSYDPDGVRRFRTKELASRIDPSRAIDPALLYWFHASHGASPDAYSPCMHREDAETVSFSWVIVSEREIRFLYSPAAPCKCSPSSQKILPRAA
ncbi:MAG TPA: NRDE family protein [Bryobacteraceae bacterium]|jgi:hypothetical protein